MGQDEIQRLILEVKGADELAVLNKQLDNETSLLKSLAADLRQGNITQAQFELAARATAGTMAGLNAQIAGLNSQAKQFSGQGGLQLSYIVDDLANSSGDWTRHLASISNNMPGFLMSLGAGAGLAGQLSLVFTGLTALLPLAKSFWEAMTGSLPEEAKKRLEEIKKAAEEAAASFNKLVEKPTHEEAESQQAVESALTGPQGRQVQDAMVKAMEATGTGARQGMTPEDVAKLPLPMQMQWKAAELVGGEAGLGMKQRLMESGAKPLIDQIMAERIRAERLASAQTAMGDAFGGKTRADREAGMMTIRGLQQAHPEMFPAAFSADLPHMTQEGVAADAAESDAASEAFDAQNQAYKQRKAQARKDKAAEKKMAHEIAQATARDRQAVERVDAEHDRQIDRAAKEADRAVQDRLHHGSQDGAFRQLAAANQRTGAGLSDAQLNQAAAETVRLNEAGLRMDQALTQAFERQLRAMQSLRAQYEAAHARLNGLMMGPDFSGSFSQLTPMPGYQ